MFLLLLLLLLFLGYTQGFKSGTKDLFQRRKSAAGMDFDYEIDRIYIALIVHEWARNFRALSPDH